MHYLIMALLLIVFTGFIDHNIKDGGLKSKVSGEKKMNELIARADHVQGCDGKLRPEMFDSMDDKLVNTTRMFIECDDRRVKIKWKSSFSGWNEEEHKL